MGKLDIYKQTDYDFILPIDYSLTLSFFLFFLYISCDYIIGDNVANIPQKAQWYNGTLCPV